MGKTNTLDLIYIALKLDDAETVLNLIRTSWSLFELYNNKIIWKRLVLINFKSCAYLYENLPIMELNWYTEFKLLINISSYSKTKSTEYFITPNPLLFIDNACMMNMFLRQRNVICRKWNHSSSNIGHQEEYIENLFLYDTTKLSWRLEYNLKNCSFYKKPIKPSIRLPHFIRCYMVIPSYLFYHRLLLLFSNPQTHLPLQRESIWNIRLVNHESRIVINFQDFRCGIRITVKKGSLDNRAFQTDLIELLNFITHPFFTYDISGAIFHNELCFRKQLATNFNDFYHCFYANSLSERQDFEMEYRQFCQTYTNVSSDLFFTKTCNYYCYATARTSFDTKAALDLQKDLTDAWHVTDRISNEMTRIIYDPHSKDWLLCLQSYDHHDLSYKSLTRFQFVDFDPLCGLKELMPSSLALYRLLCLFPNINQRQFLSPYIWNIRITHKNSGRILEFSDYDGTLTISVLNDFELIYNNESNMIAISNFDPSVARKFFSDVVVFLNNLITDDVFHPLGIVAGMIA